MSIVSGTVTRVRRVPALAWILVALAVAVIVKTAHSYCRDPEDRSWLDPQQPPINVDVDMRATKVLPPAFRPPTLYPYNSLTEHPGCWVGDC